MAEGGPLNDRPHTRRQLSKAAAILLAALVDRATRIPAALAQPASPNDRRKAVTKEGCCCCDRYRENERAEPGRGQRPSIADRLPFGQSKERVRSARCCCCDRCRQGERIDIDPPLDARCSTDCRCDGSRRVDRTDANPPLDVRDQQTDRENEARYRSGHCCCSAHERRERAPEGASEPVDECRCQRSEHETAADDDDCCCCCCDESPAITQVNPWEVSQVPFRPVRPVTNPCFLRGTLIRTISGFCPVEDLRVGDLLPTAFGGQRPICSIRQARLDRPDRSSAWPAVSRPIRIGRSALAAGIPDRDLVVTAAHALLVDGYLVTAGDLVNGCTIVPYETEHTALDIFHFRFATHDVIDAHGAPCESLLLPGEQACAPRLGFNGRRSELESRLRSAVAPWIDRRQPLDVIRDRLEARMR